MDILAIVTTILLVVFLILYIVKLKVDNKELKNELEIYGSVIENRNRERDLRRAKKTAYQREYRARKKREAEALLENNKNIDV